MRKEDVKDREALSPADQGKRFLKMANDYQSEAKCSWREACHVVKRRHPEARAALVAYGATKRLA